jgi:hypothetical protein
MNHALKENHSKKRALWAAMSINEPVFDEASVNVNLSISFALVNDSSESIKPALESSMLLVNGKESENWKLSIGQGIQPQYADLLPPGTHLVFGYAMGKEFAKPGIYRVQWKSASFETKEIVFRVLPAR